MCNSCQILLTQSGMNWQGEYLLRRCFRNGEGSVKTLVLVERLLVNGNGIMHRSADTSLGKRLYPGVPVS